MIQGNMFNIGDRAFLVTDPDQKEWLVVQVRQNAGNTFSYILVCGTAEYIALEMEMTSEADVVKSLT